MLFGIHPLRVESVVWVSERKDVLFVFFFLLAIYSYIKYTGWKKYSTYLVSLVFFTLALMSKPMAVSLPVVLLILDYFPLERLHKGKGRGIEPGVLFEKIPFIALSFLFAIAAFWAQSLGGAVSGFEKAPLVSRIFVMFRAYVFYVYKTFLPFNLAPFYPYPKFASGYFTFMNVAAVLFFIVVSAICLLLARREKLYISAWAYYVFTLLPVVGIVQVGAQSAADRYTYLPGIALFLVIGLFVAMMINRYSGKIHRSLITVICIFILCFLVIKTGRQIQIWENSGTLWSYELSLYDRVAPVYNNRAQYEIGRGNYAEAIKDLNIAIELSPDYATGYFNRALCEFRLGNFKNVIADLVKGSKFAPLSAKSYNYLGVSYAKLSEYKLSAEAFSNAIEIGPTNALLYYNRGFARAKLGELNEAVHDFTKGIEISPDSVTLYGNRGEAFLELGEFKKAEKDFQKTIKLEPRLAKAYQGLARAQTGLGQREKAARNFKIAEALVVKEAR